MDPRAPEPDSGGVDGGLGEMDERLYSRSAPPHHTTRHDFHDTMSKSGVDDTWSAHEPMPTKRKSIIPSHSFLKKAFVVSAVFFVLSFAYAAYSFIRTPEISPKNVVIEIVGPASIGAGEELDLQLTITNRNPVALQDVDLIIEYPEGTRSAQDIGKSLLRAVESLGTIKPGEVVRRSASALLFGEEGSIRQGASLR